MLYMYITYNLFSSFHVCNVIWPLICNVNIIKITSTVLMVSPANIILKSFTSPSLIRMAHNKIAEYSINRFHICG